MEDNSTQIVQFGQIEIKADEFNADPDFDCLPILATRNLVLFPGISLPVSLKRESSVELAKAAFKGRYPIGIVCQTDPECEQPMALKDFFRYGVVADVFQVIDLPDGSQTAIVKARGRMRLLGKARRRNNLSVFEARAIPLEPDSIDDAKTFEITMEEVSKLVSSLAGAQGGDKMMIQAMEGITDLEMRLNFTATNLPEPPARKIDLLKLDLDERASALLAVLLDEQAKYRVYEEIVEKAKRNITENQRNAFLQSQMDAIRTELYGDATSDDDAENLRTLAINGGMPEHILEVFDRQLVKLRRLNPTTPDYSVEYSYLETLATLPWNATDASADIADARKILEDQHYGLEKIKQRILEQIAVILFSPFAKTPIICLVGPPGVGKTSLGRSIAQAMGRKYERVSLGGVHDEAEIRGHRRTYIGAMPGRIIKAIKKAGCTNPVLLLDEVDKLGRDHKGDPSAALLEVLDPEQNKAFHDNYLDIDYDLSHVLFIATANSTATIDPPLLDRMEVIDLSGYLIEEKVQIAKRHLLPKVMEENGFNGLKGFKLTDKAIVALIENYTSESGVRELEKLIATLMRKFLLNGLESKPFPSPIKPENLQELLGLPKYNKDRYESSQTPGVVTGLAWTQVGGEILLAEASLAPGKDGKVSITGNLGNVMKESVTIAYQWVKSHAAEIGIPAGKIENNNLHVHFPEGAIPKDGPSAGITIATAIASAFLGRPVKERIAMTGEITLRGKVLPVGGIKEKILAAKRAGIKTIILSAQNRRDVEDIPAKYLTGLTFEYIDTVADVLATALPK